MSIEPLPVPPARQARSRVTQDRILVAGTRLLEEGGPEALTVAAVAEAAGVAVGSVYTRFGDKERLLGAIQVRFTEEFSDEFRQRVAVAGLTSATSPARVIATAVRGVGETFAAHEPLFRVFLLLGTRSQMAFDVGARASVEGGRAFRDFVMLAAASLRHHPDVEVATDFAFRLTFAACAHRVVHGAHLESARPLSWEEMIDQLCFAVAAYLLTSADLIDGGAVVGATLRD
ncbi:TetR/AcrR family transcriptional regulator [Blastococcus sp. SYSU D00820]